MFRLVLFFALIVAVLVVYDTEKVGQTTHAVADHSSLNRNNTLSPKQFDPSFFPKDISIVALGDSLTSGYGDQSGKGGYVSVLKQSLQIQRGIGDISISNFAIGGLRSEQLINELNKTSIQDAVANADYILITIGGNDVMRVAQNNIFTLSKEAFEKENVEFTNKIRRIIQKLNNHKPDAKLFFVGIYNPFSTLLASVPELDNIIEKWNEGTEKVVSNYENTYFIPISDLFKGNEDEYLFDDYIHPNEEGYKQLAGRIFTYLGQFDHHSIYVGGEVIKKE